jgi:hypothetical protein
VRLARRLEELPLTRWSADDEFEDHVLAILRILPLRNPQMVAARAMPCLPQVTDRTISKGFRLLQPETKAGAAVSILAALHPTIRPEGRGRQPDRRSIAWPPPARSTAAWRAHSALSNMSPKCPILSSDRRSSRLRANASMWSSRTSAARHGPGRARIRCLSCLRMTVREHSKNTIQLSPAVRASMKPQ